MSASNTILRAQQLTKSYGSGAAQVHALRGVDLALHSSELIVLIGASGSGKSTLLNILGGLDVPSGGSVQFRGAALAGSDDAALTRYRREHVGFVFQEQRVNVIIDLVDPPQCWRGLNHGYQVEPHIVIWEAPQVVRVPLAALFRVGEQWALFTVDADRAVLRTVKIDRRNGTHAQVVSGIDVGERIVLHPNDRLSHGVRIATRAESER
jgi:multidrug efflux pump subunit AcrA (membrane-fusion protein)